MDVLNQTLQVSIRDRLTDHVGTASYSRLAIYAAGFLWVTSLFTAKGPLRVPGAKVVGSKGWWEPSILLQFRFFYDATSIINAGYQKFKNDPFVLTRYDTDVTILPMKYLEQIRSFPKHKLNRTHALLKVIVPKWTGLSLLLESDLVSRSLLDKLMPNFDMFLTNAANESKYSFKNIFPQSEEWVEADIGHCVLNLVASMSGRIFVGLPACRDPSWLHTSVAYSEDLGITSYIIRMFPEWSYPVVTWLIPFRWRLRRHYKVAEKLVNELKQERQKSIENGEKPQETLINWMLEKGNEKETRADMMAGLQCFLTLTSVHTTSLTFVSGMFQLCRNPQYIEVLREEIEQVVKEYGWVTESELTPRQWAAKLEKMDSYIVETTRFDPILAIGPNRYAMTDIDLKDGTKIPAGAVVGMPAYHHVHDPDVIPDPTTFDPLRSYRARYENGGENMSKFLAGQTSATQLSFGHGGQACPGRHYAVHQIKFTLARILLEYDFKWPEGKSSKNFFINEVNVLNPFAKIMMKKRPNSIFDQ